MDRYSSWDEAVNAASLLNKPVLVIIPSATVSASYHTVVDMNRALPTDDVVAFVDGDFARKVFM